MGMFKSGIPKPMAKVAVGKAVADSFSFFLGSEWVWGAVGVAWGSLLMYTLAGVCALTYTNPERPRPTGEPCHMLSIPPAACAVVGCLGANQPLPSSCQPRA